MSFVRIQRGFDCLAALAALLPLRTTLITRMIAPINCKSTGIFDSSKLVISSALNLLNSFTDTFKYEEWL